MSYQHLFRVGAMLIVLAGLFVVPLPVTPVYAGDGGYIFDDINVKLFSIGGRATWFDPKEGSARWFGGAQVRVYPFKFLAIEGSADYRRTDFGDTRVHTYPVQVSALLYLLPGKRLSPFILGGGGWYYTTVKGPGGFDDTQNRFGGHVGGGLQFWFNDWVSVDGTYRHIWLEDVNSRDQNIKDKDFRDSGQMVTVGLNFHF
jgi:opacity protein-like surface antigen